MIEFGFDYDSPNMTPPEPMTWGCWLTILICIAIPLIVYYW